MSPAMVSKHVQTLEERLGVRLLNRTTRRMSVTEVGQPYYEHCLRILAELEEADGAARDLQTAPRGLLKGLHGLRLIGDAFCYNRPSFCNRTFNSAMRCSPA